MKTAIHFSLMLIVSAISRLDAQDVNIIVSKGSAQVGNIKFNSGYRFDITGKKDVILGKRSKAIVFGFERRFEIENPKDQGERLSVKMLSDNLKRQPAKSGFNGYLLKNYQKFDEDRYTAGTQAAGVEGLDNKRSDVRRTDAGDVFSPVDSARLLGNSVKIEWQLKKALVKPKLVVYDLSTKAKVLEQDVGQQGEFTWEVPSDGVYKWEIHSPAERKPLRGGIFIKAPAAEQAKLLSDFETFKSDISDLSTDTQYELLSDYKRNTKIVMP